MLSEFLCLRERFNLEVGRGRSIQGLRELMVVVGTTGVG